MELALQKLDDARNAEMDDEVIAGLLDDGLVVMAAKEGSGKTFLGIHMAAHIISGKDWNKGAVRKGAVVYCNAEGVSFFPHRVTTALDWIEESAKDTPFFMLARGGDLVTRNGKRSPFVDELYTEILKMEGKEGVNTRLIVFDTLNRYMPGGNENDQMEAGGLIDGCMYLRQELESHPTILLMHHLSKEGKVRGSTAITGAADQVLVCERTGGLLDAPILWTTHDEKGLGKRKDRDAVKQWFRFRRVPLSRGDGIPDDALDDVKGIPHFVRVWVPKDEMDPDPDYEPSYKMDGLEYTLIMEPCTAPTEEEGLETPSTAKVLGIVAKEGSVGITKVMREADMTQKAAYKAVDRLVRAGKIKKDDDTKRYSLASDNPFEEAANE